MGIFSQVCSGVGSSAYDSEFDLLPVNEEAEPDHWSESGGRTRFHALDSFTVFEQSERRLPPLRSVLSLPWNYSEESTMSNEQVAPETKGVTVKLLATVDLGPEIEGMAGRQLRMRLVTIEPGGVFGPIHDHRGRPGTVYILQGTITDHRDGVATDYGPGVGWPEDRNTTHWLENKGTILAVEISVDIVTQD